MLRLAEERRVVGRDRVEHGGELEARPVVLEMSDVLLECAEAAPFQQFLQAGRHERALAAMQRDAALRIDQAGDRRQIAIGEHRNRGQCGRHVLPGRTWYLVLGSWSVPGPWSVLRPSSVLSPRSVRAPNLQSHQGPRTRDGPRTEDGPRTKYQAPSTRFDAEPRACGARCITGARAVRHFPARDRDRAGSSHRL